MFIYCARKIKSGEDSSQSVLFSIILFHCFFFFSCLLHRFSFLCEFFDNQPRQHIKKQRYYLPTKIRLVKAMFFPLVMYGCELDCKESWVLKNWCFWTVVLKKTLESPLDCKEIQPVHLKGAQSWVFIGRTDAEAETPILWPPDGKNWRIRKDPDAGKDWRQEEKGTTEVEMVGWHHRLNGHEFEQAPEVGDGQGGLVCCSPWGCRVGHNWATELN